MGCQIQTTDSERSSRGRRNRLKLSSEKYLNYRRFIFSFTSMTILTLCCSDSGKGSVTLTTIDIIWCKRSERWSVTSNYILSRIWAMWPERMHPPQVFWKDEEGRTIHSGHSARSREESILTCALFANLTVGIILLLFLDDRYARIFNPQPTF